MVTWSPASENKDSDGTEELGILYDKTIPENIFYLTATMPQVRKAVFRFVSFLVYGNAEYVSNSC